MMNSSLYCRHKTDPVWPANVFTHSSWTGSHILVSHTYTQNYPIIQKSHQCSAKIMKRCTQNPRLTSTPVRILIFRTCAYSKCSSSVSKHNTASNLVINAAMVCRNIMQKQDRSVDTLIVLSRSPLTIFSLSYCKQ